MGQYRLDSIAQLAKQLRFTPIARRLEQLARSESLLLQLRAGQTYTIGQIIFAITSYEPKQPDSTMLTGEALQHDLGLLVEEVGESLQLHVNAVNEPILSIDDVAQRLNVTSKTVQRWRRKGLPAGRYTFSDGKRRIGFRFSSVQSFMGSGSPETAPTEPTQRPPRSHDLAWLQNQARQLAEQGYWELLAGHRLASATGISPLSVVQLLREHVPGIAYAPAPDNTVRRQVLHLAEQATRSDEIARHVGLPLYGVYRIILDHRVRRATRKPIRFIDDSLYHQDNAEQVTRILAEQTSTETPAIPERLPRDLPPYLRDLYRIAPMSRVQERGWFLRYHYLRYLAAQRQKAIDPQTATYRELRQLDRLVRNAMALRSRIVEANLRLVVSVARKHLRPPLALMDLVSEGNMILIRSVESFDVHRGYRFATYAVYALMKGFARYIPSVLSQQSQVAEASRLEEVHDPSWDQAATQAELRDLVQRLMAKLGKREQQVLAGRYGLCESQIPQTFQQLGEQLSLSRQRIIQIEQQAIAKLRSLHTTQPA